jgi:hypothetical protein
MFLSFCENILFVRRGRVSLPAKACANLAGGCGCPVDTSVQSTEAPTEAAAETNPSPTVLDLVCADLRRRVVLFQQKNLAYDKQGFLIIYLLGFV